MLRRPTGLGATVVGVLAVFSWAWPSGAAAAESAPSGPSLGLGWEYDLSGAREEFLLPDPLLDPSVTAEHPFYLRLRVPWTLVEPRPGTYAWEEVDRVVDAYRAAHHVALLCLYGGNPSIDGTVALPTSERPAVVKAWLDMLRAAALHFKGRVLSFEIGRAPNLEPDWSGDGVREYAYLLKQSSVTVRSADPEVLVAEGMLAIPEGGLEAALLWQAGLYAQDVATYVDALPLSVVGAFPRQPAISRTYELILEHDPSARLWTFEDVPDGGTERERASDLMRRLVVGQGEGASLSTFDLEADVEGRPDDSALLLDLHKLFLPGYRRQSGGADLFRKDADAPGPPPGIVAYRYFDAASYNGLVAFFSPEAAEAPHVTLVLDTAAVRGMALYDLVGGSATAVEGARADFRSNSTKAPVPLRRRPQVLLYSRVPIAGFEAGKEQVAVTDTSLITVQEIVAGHQRFMADQNFLLRNYRASGRVTYHYKISGSSTIDVAYDNAFFWEREKGAEWQQTAMYINGVRWKGTKFPNIPFIQPEKVVSLPLDIHLNEDYDYEYAGREEADGYDCYVVAFRPRDRSGALYEGKVWIETRTFARVRTSVVQHGLETPVTSNEERDRYQPVAGPDGATYWLLAGVDGQQIFTTAGRNLVVLREIEMEDFRINDPGFAEARAQAYASEAPILRDTDRGFRYLTRGADGQRTVEQEPTRKTLFALGGLYAQPGLDYPVPLLGVNYFNYNVKDKESQLNAFLGGAYNLITFSDPALFGRVDGTVEALLIAFDLTDTVYLRGESRDESNVDRKTQRVSAWLGLPLGNFFRVGARYDLEYVNSSDDEDTDTFVVPVDGPQHTLAWQGEFNRAGWTVTASAGKTLRTDWEPWGDETAATPETALSFPGSPCDTPGSCLAEFDPSQDTFTTYQLGVAKQFFLPAFQKIRAEATWMEGGNLDRFSEYSLGFLDNRVRGLSGAGVRYDQGGIARLQYAFNVQDVIRFEASLDHAYVRDGLTSETFEHFTGFGISGNILGPWQTILSFDVGVALDAAYEGLRGDTEGQIVLFKFF